MHLDYYLIDATAPFFLALDAAGEVNWSKVPFDRLEKGDGLDGGKCEKIVAAFEKYVDSVKLIGYNSISLDDAAHLVNHTLYRGELRKKIDDYILLYSRLFTIAHLKNMRVFITTDILFFNDEIEAHTGMDERENIRFFCGTVILLFKRFPDISGIIIRIGESDGVDVCGDFRSRIVIKTARQCRRYLREALAVCEQFDKQLIVRTWTLGAFPVGDLMWNPVTFHAVFSNLPSENLIISQKYGETDFFRYLTMSPLLFEGSHRRIVEFQARREYEGFGEFPSFIGFDYERYARYLNTCPTLVGISVWCQTGGWSHFRRITYLLDSSIWVELNVFAVIRIFRDSGTAEDAAVEFISEKAPGTDPQQFIRFLRLSEKAIKELWYIPEFAVQRIYFRRTRVPPLLYVFWDTVIINHTMRKIIRRFVHERREAIHDGYRALDKIEQMKQLAVSMHIDTKDIDFQYDTFRILAAVREYYFGEWNTDTVRHLRHYIDDYREKYPEGFHIADDFKPVKFKKRLIKGIFRISLRRQPTYRYIDRLFLLRFAWLVYPVFRAWEKKRLPSFTRSQAMGIEVLFK